MPEVAKNNRMKLSKMMVIEGNIYVVYIYVCVIYIYMYMRYMTYMYMT